MMLKVGLTGGIGSGKSTVAKIFELLQIPVYYADSAAKRLMNTSAELKKEINKIFGEVYINGVLDRKKIASIVFKNKEKLDALNSVVHPVVRNDFLRWAENQKSTYVIEEAAILFESGSYVLMDKIISVYAPKEIRIERVRLRDRASREQVLERMKNQWPDDKKIALSDFVIKNYGDYLVIPQVLEIHKVLSEIVSS